MDESIPLIQPNRTPGLTFCSQLRRRCVCVSSKPAIIILIWNFLVSVAYSFGISAFNAIALITFQSSFNWIALQFATAAVIAIFWLLYPLAGYTADAHCGRGKTIAFGLLSVLGGLALGLLLLVILEASNNTHSLLTDSKPGELTTAVIIIGLITLLVLVGAVAFWANIVQFGTDQLQEASGDQLSIFIHLFVWTSYIGFGTGELLIAIAICSESRVLPITVTVFSFIVVLFTLCFSYFTRRWFTTVNFGTQNPYKTTFKVLKFALKHKHPLQRSAFTYCEDELPSRLDLGKEKYGGPFATEQVEDVKAVICISVILLLVSITFAINQNVDLLTDSLFKWHMHTAANTTTMKHCTVKAALLDFSGLPSLTVAVLVPVYVWIIRPCCGRYLPNMLQKMAIGMSVAFMSIMWTFAMDTYGHAKHRNVPCMFVANYNDVNTNSTAPATLELDAALLILPGIMDGIAQMFILVTAFEFICAQSPHLTKGLLVGLFFAMEGFFYLIGILLMLSFYFPWKKPTFPSCGFGYYLLNALLVFVGLILFITFARKYKYRQRDEVSNVRKFAEAYYEQREVGELSLIR